MSSLMNSLGSADYVAIALAVGGLVAVLWEIAAKSPRSFLEIITDTRRFAEHPLSAAERSATAPAPAKPIALETVSAARQPQLHDRRLAA